MKNITLSADEEMIASAREEARARKTTLNQLFRDWLTSLARHRERQEQVRSLMARLDYVEAGGPFTREELNER